MSLDAAWALGQSASFATMGVPAVVNRPAPLDAPIETSVIWVSQTTQGDPTGAAFARTEGRFVAVFDRHDVPQLPRGSRFTAALIAGGTEYRWEVDQLDRSDVDQLRAIVVRVDEP